MTYIDILEIQWADLTNEFNIMFKYLYIFINDE